MDNAARSADHGPMGDTFALRFLLAKFGGWVNRQQARAIACLVEENRVLREQLGERRIR